ncbi:MAG TPA: lipid A biosynthesis acyltransferase [Sedimenticola thiotaurini]|uniref:Lipid A biosynthesis acyltransferase n=1 Tax=Sedimenticola thiotaurini TaxID=1543721 RepID=A0A831RN37_9GAMM|nr:lipid A biosynthesis acyltransferase [Sedimenticola thiotaurini]
MREKILLFTLGLLSRLPLRFAHGAGALAGRLFCLFPNRERETAATNIALCLPELAPADRERLIRRSLQEAAKTLLEMPVIWRREPDHWLKLLQQGEGMELPGRLLQGGRGLIVLAPHLGCWEAGLHYLETLAPVTALYRPPRDPALESVMLAGRRKGGARLVPTTGAGVRALYQALRRNELVTILPDQEPKQTGDKGGVFAPFFGVPALTMVLIGRLVRRTGAAVVFSYAERLPAGSGYRVHFLAAPDGIGDADPVVSASALNLGVEQCVRRCPEQYQWSYRRFSIRPDGAPSPYLRAGTAP